MTLPPRRHVALALIAVAGLCLALRPRPPEPADDGPDADPAAQMPVVVHLRLHAKIQIARDVIDGRRSLLDAAALFRELDRVPPAAICGVDQLRLRQPIPTRTEEERYCRSVVAWVWTGIVGSQGPGDDDAWARAEAAVARLAAEFEDELGRRGAIRLPDPSALEPVETLLEQARAEWKTLPRRQPRPRRRP